jgi:hypothetical protein
MARGTTASIDASLRYAYRGAPGKTQTTTVHVAGARGELIAAQVHTTIEASDAELVERFHAEEFGLNVIQVPGGTPVKVAVPVLYHDPAAELFVLVLDERDRHRELDERIRLYERLRADEAPIPAYVKEFVVVYGAAQLRAHVARRAEEAAERARGAQVDALRAELDQRGRDLDEVHGTVADLRAELGRARAALAEERGEVERLRAALPPVPPALPDPPEPPEPPALEAVEIVPPPPEPEPTEHTTKPIPKSEISDISAAIDAAQIIDESDAPVESETKPEAAAIIPPGADPLTTQTRDLPADHGADAWLDHAAERTESTLALVGGGARLALVAGEHIARGLGGALDVRVVLHRLPTYPVIAVVIGPPPALRVPSPTQLALITLDIAADGDRALLAALTRRFEVVVDIITRQRRIRRVKLTAPLAENLGFITRAAEDHLREITAEGGAADLDTALAVVHRPGFDLLGAGHPEATEFRDDKLAQLQTAQQLRRAISVARRFARPAAEDYLVCTRGFPLPRWRELRRHVLESAVAWGLWMGPDLAQVAVSEGLARSRRDLVNRLDRGFETLRKEPAAFDIDEDAAEDNAKAIADEARALGVTLGRSRGVSIASDEVSQVSGSIDKDQAHDATAAPIDRDSLGDGTPAFGLRSVGRARPTKGVPTDELLALLDNRDYRAAAAVELCERAEPRTAAPVIAAVEHLPRAEAVRVLGMAVKFGDAAKQPLLAGLASHKAYLRHGCALALAMLRAEDATQAVIDLLFTEPTEIWRELARAIGQVGPNALLPLAASYGRLGERTTAQITERVAWAMAHVAVRGGKAAIETMAGGQSVVAPVARQALALHAAAASDQVRVRNGADGSQPGREVTVNRAFSRRFFEAVDQGAGQGLPEELDEADLIEEEEAIGVLDETDLIRQ